MSDQTERLWCTACGTVTRDQRCDCNRWPDDHEMKREPHFVNYADAMQETAHEQAQQIDALVKALQDCLREHGGFTIRGNCEKNARAALAKVGVLT